MANGPETTKVYSGRIAERYAYPHSETGEVILLGRVEPTDTAKGHAWFPLDPEVSVGQEVTITTITTPLENGGSLSSSHLEISNLQK